jgi:lipopolysaccharide/colanic/teichoic acid biosynthesis glycosyltransferase
VKRTFDIAVAFVALVAAAPLIVLAAVAVKLYDGGPVFYASERVGKGGVLFRMLKFRTMIQDAERRGGTSTSADDPRLTPVGRVLRDYKVDELPQLVNVLTGDMSIVGPRPQVAWAVQRYSEAERRLLSVPPGITDYASIAFRDEAEILRGAVDADQTYLKLIAPEKIRLGLLYVETRSLGTDVKIVLGTVWAMAGGNPARILGGDLVSHASSPAERSDLRVEEL